VREALLSILAMLAAVAPVAAQEELEALARTHVPRLEQVLTENIQDFWLEKGLDRPYGGYLISYDNEGRLIEPYTKMIVTQSRQLWLHSRLARAGYERQANLDAAAWGFRFLANKMWDARYGGFFWEVGASGAVRRKLKRLYGQAFALYALSEYYLASRDKEALEWAHKLYDVLESKVHDREHGGYPEMFNRDWSPRLLLPATTPMKSGNTHMHLLEAFTTYYRASKLPLVRHRLLELIEIQTRNLVREGRPACTERYAPDWTPRLDGDRATVSYGHDLENIWLIMDACEAAGEPVAKYRALFESVFEHTLEYGFDEEKGGFFGSGSCHQPATDRTKYWWVEAEALVATLWMYHLTGEPKYLQVFAKTWDFVDKHLVDWEHGEWNESVTPAGEVTGTKASIWKAGYHSGRSMIESLAALRMRRRNG
jgi:mannobiose 2-epimerase